MTGVSLLLVFVLAKTIALWGRDIAWSPTTVAAFFWQDALVAVAFGACEWASGAARAARRITWCGYWTLVFYVAINVPVAIVLSTPLTWPMLRAASGTLADSIVLYATWRNALFMASTLAAAAVLPRLLARAPQSVHRAALAALLLVAAAGRAAEARLDTMGLHRNAIVALATSALPRVDAEAAAGTWTTPPFEQPEADDYSHLRGRARGRNVVLVSLESTAAQYLRLYGARENVTPRLDTLAEQALVFEHAYAVYPESIKGLFSILCSVFPAFDTTPAVYGRTPCRPIAAVLADASYRTALFHSGRFAYLGMDSIVAARGYEVLEDAGHIGGQHESSFGVDEPSTVARMLSWIDSVPASQPFFLTYLPIAGHHPYEVPGKGPFPDNEEIGRYRNALHYGDRAVGMLIDGLRARGLDRRTVWIVLGDHGEALGQHEGNYGHTFFLYDENVRVPFLVAAPGLIDRTMRSRTIVSLVDTAPTLLDLLGLPVPALHQGQSALGGRPRMALFFTDYSLPLAGLRDGRWKFVHELDSGRSKLFDLLHDPAEKADLAGAHPVRASAYARTLRAWSAAQKAQLLGARHDSRW